VPKALAGGDSNVDVERALERIAKSGYAIGSGREEIDCPVIALITCGNAFFKAPIGRHIVISPVFVTHSVFAFCEKAEFVDRRSLPLQGERATDLLCLRSTRIARLAQLARLRTEGDVSLGMSYGPRMDYRTSGDQGSANRKRAGFVGGGGWLIESIGSSSSDHWEGRWQLGDRSRAERKIWSVSHGRIASRQPHSKIRDESVENISRSCGTILRWLLILPGNTIF
jgi:hypothetical protein